MDKHEVMKLAKKHWAKPPSAVQEKAAEESAAEPAKRGKKSPAAKGKGKAAMANEEEEQEEQAGKAADDDDEVVTGFRPELVEKLYAEELGGGDKPAELARVVVLELSQYLENYLWPYFDATTATKAHLMSILAMVNEKFREGVPAWACFHATHSEAFPALMKRVLALKKQTEFSLYEKTTYLLFFIHCFQSLEDTMVRAVMLPLVSLPLWRNLSEGRLQLELRATPALEKHWKNLAKKDAKAAKLPDYTPPDARPETWFVPAMFAEFLDVMQAAVVTEEAAEGEPVATGHVTTADTAAVLYCERFLELLGDLLSQLPTRRFVRTLMEDSALLVKCRLSALHGHPRGRLFSQLTDLVRSYQAFQINDHTGAHLTDEDVSLAHAERITQLQRLVFKHVPKLMELALSTVSSLEKRTTLQRYLEMLTAEDTFLLCCEQLRLLSPDDPWAMRLDCLREVLITTFEKPQSQRQAINELPLYPTERILWDENMVPSLNYTGQSVLALPKLNLQFLTFHDYLLRNFNLFRLEATYEIREDIRDVVKRLKPVLVEREEEDVVAFSGWARMALPTTNFAVTEVAKPKVGEVKPARVHADLTVDLSRLGGEARWEWDQLRQHDVLFLLCMTPPQLLDHPVEAVEEQAGLRYVRGCEVVELRDEKGNLMNDFTGRVRHDQQRPPEGNLRTLTVALDTAQYQLDVDSVVHDGAEDVYKTMNVVMRRKPKENNFKAILECIRDLMNDDCVMPDWLHDIFLGYGDPGAAHYSKMPNQLRTVTFKDTFVDKQHLLDSFPNNKVEFVGEHAADPKPPFKVTFPAPAPAAEPVKKRKKGGEAEQVETATAEQVDNVIRVESFIPPDPGPFPQDQPRTNTVRFTSTQVEAIRAGVNPGLTMVVGPPGTGKTDVAVQILSELYHNFPGQRTLVITHSNHALNDLFVKIMERDIAARHLLRLGMGEQELDTDIDFSRAGRVNSMLARRLQLLAEVEKLARTLEITDDIAYTCETAAHFWLLHVYSRWEEYLVKVDAKRKLSEADAAAAVGALFPFTKYFASAPQPIFHGASFQADMRAANGCMRHLKIIFQELDECRGFEIMKNQGDRSKLLLTKQARIVAMTCTHAAMKRHEFLQLGLQYDNLLMEESAQILEIETFIPMLLQKQEGGRSRLKRVVLIGDHHQLPPVVKNMAFQKYSHMDQSLFTRFVRLGTPTVQLNRQVNSPSI
jgi:intron-binding protein aquarius